MLFDTRYNGYHGRFVLWIRSMAQSNNSLKVVTNLSASTKWKPEYTLPVSGGKAVPIMRVLNRSFRVKLKIQRVYYKIVNNGYPQLLIQHFEFK